MAPSLLYVPTKKQEGTVVWSDFSKNYPFTWWGTCYTNKGEKQAEQSFSTLFSRLSKSKESEHRGQNPMLDIWRKLIDLVLVMTKSYMVLHRDIMWSLIRSITPLA